MKMVKHLKEHFETHHYWFLKAHTKEQLEVMIEKSKEFTKL